MQRFFIRLIIALLTFFIGVSAYRAWDRRQEIINACVEFMRNYQD
jgi:hypothetical protein